jgi:hypothetical protein
MPVDAGMGLALCWRLAVYGTKDAVVLGVSLPDVTGAE